MTDDRSLIRFTIPTDFVLDCGVPTPNELAWGFQAGWLSVAGAVDLAARKFARGCEMDPVECELAFLLADRRYEADDLLASLTIGDEPTEARASFWLFVVLAYLLEHPETVDDVYRAIDLIYADFDSPPAIASMVSYMAPFLGFDSARESIRARWIHFVQLERERYANRSAPGQ